MEMKNYKKFCNEKGLKESKLRSLELYIKECYKSM